MTWKPKKFLNSGEVELSEEDKKQQKKQQKEYIRYFTTKDVPEGYKELYDDGGYEIRNYKLQQTPIIEQPLTLNVLKPDIYRYEQTIPTFSPALSEYAYTGPEMNYYHSQRRHEGQNIGIYTTKEPKIKIEDFDYPGILNEEDIKIFNRKNYFYGLYSPKTDKIYFHHPLNFRNDYDWIVLNHEWDHYIRKHLFPTNNYGIIKSALSELSNLNIAPTPLPETLTTSFKNYILNNNILNYFNKDINKNKFYGFTEELSATLGTLKDFLKKKFGDKVTLEELDDEVLDAFPTNLRNSYTDVIFPWIKSLNTGQKQRLLDWMNNPYNVVYNDSKQDKFKDRWYPEQQVEMARRGTKIRMGKNDLDSDNIDEKSDKLPSWWDYDYNDVILHYNKLHLDKNQLQTLQDIVDVFNETGYSEGVKKAILHNIFLESGFNPNVSNGSHYGLLQWTPNIFNSLSDKSAKGQARKIILILTNPKMGTEVRAAYLPEGVHTSEETANFFRALTNPQDSLYYFNAAVVTNGRTKDEAKLNARAVANSGKYIEQNGYAGDYIPGNPLDEIIPQSIPPIDSDLEEYNNKSLYDYKTFSYKKGGKMFGWRPKQIRKGQDDLDTDDLNADDKTYRSNERYAIGVTPTRVALVESYEPGSHDYERYGKTSDIYIGNQGSGSYDQWATKDLLKEADIQEQKRIRNLSGPSAFNPTAATDYFNKAVGVVMSPIITGIKTGYNYIKDIPLTFNTSPSVGLSLPTASVGRITLSDVADNPTVRGFGNGLFSVLTPSKDFGFVFSVGDALSSGDFSKIKAPWNPTNYGFATSLDDKMGQAMNTEVDWIIPLAGAPTVADKGKRMYQMLKMRRAALTTKKTNTARTSEIVMANAENATEKANRQVPYSNKSLIASGKSPTSTSTTTFNFNLTPSTKWLSLTPEQRLLRGIDQTTGMLTPEYIIGMYKAAGNRLANGIRSPKIGYWNVSKTPIITLNIHDPLFLRQLKQIIDSGTKPMDAFFQTKQVKEIVEKLKNYDLDEQQINTVISWLIKDQYSGNSRALSFFRKSNYPMEPSLEFFFPDDYKPVIVLNHPKSDLYNRLKSLLTKRHEQGHIATYPTAQTLPEEIENSIRLYFKDMPIFQNYFTNSKGTDIGMRFSQSKDLFHLLPGEKLTWNQLLYALKNYGKLTGKDNSMTELYNWAKTVNDPKLQNTFLQHFNNPKNAYSIFGPITLTLGLGATAATQ